MVPEMLDPLPFGVVAEPGGLSSWILRHARVQIRSNKRSVTGLWLMLALVTGGADRFLPMFGKSS
jgi:hypothetical protein